MLRRDEAKNASSPAGDNWRVGHPYNAFFLFFVGTAPATTQGGSNFCGPSFFLFILIYTPSISSRTVLSVRGVWINWGKPPHQSAHRIVLPVFYCRALEDRRESGLFYSILSPDAK